MPTISKVVNSRSGVAQAPHSEARNDVHWLTAELRESARQAGLQPDDPMMPLIVALTHTIEFLSSRVGQTERIAIEASKRIADSIVKSRAASEAEERRIRASLATDEARVLRRIADGVVEAADTALARRVRTFDRNSAWTAAVVLLVVAAMAWAAGDWSGRSRAYSTFGDTGAALVKAAFRDGPETAQKWKALIEWNYLPGALATCVAAGRIHVDDGRRYCDLQLWIEAQSQP